MIRLEGTAAFATLPAFTSAFAGSVFVDAAVVAAAFEVVALVAPVALVEVAPSALDVEVLETKLFNVVVFGAALAAGLVVVFGAGFGAAFGATFTLTGGCPGSGSGFFARPRRAGALSMLALRSDSGAGSSPRACARCARVRTMVNRDWSKDVV